MRREVIDNNNSVRYQGSSGAAAGMKYGHIDNGHSIPVRSAVCVLACVIHCVVWAQDELPESVSIEALLAYAAVHAPSVRSAQTHVNAARADMVGAQVRVPTNPELWLSLGSRTSLGATGLEAEVSVQQQIEIAGERGARIAYTSVIQAQADAVVVEAQWGLHVELHMLSTQLLLAEERKKLAEIFVQFNEQLARIAQRQVDAGDVAPMVALVAQTDLAQAQGRLISAQQDIRLLQAQLAAVAGWPPQNPPRLVDVLPAIQKAPPEALLIERMQSSHPTLRAQDLSLVAAEHQIELAEREAWPDPTVGLSYAYEGQVGQESHVWLATVGVPLPFWQSNQGEQAHAAAQLEAAKTQRQLIELRLLTLLTDATTRLNAAADMVALYEQTVIPGSQKALSQVQRAFDLGEVDIHEVSQIRERLLRVHEQHLDAKVQYYNAAAQLEGLIGTEIFDLLNATP